LPAFFVSAPGDLSSLELSPGTLPVLFFTAAPEHRLPHTKEAMRQQP